MAQIIRAKARRSTMDAVCMRARDEAFKPEELEDLANRMAAALEEFMGWATHDAWEESKHPRRSDGKFGKGSGSPAVSAEEGAPPKPTSVQAKSAMAGLHELLSSGHAFSKEDLMRITGLEGREKKFSDYMAMLKNPKWAGKRGALNITKNERGEYVVTRNPGTEAPAAPPAAPPAPPPAPAAPPAAPVAPPVVQPPAPAPVQPPAAPASPAAAGEHMKLMAATHDPKRFLKAPGAHLKQAFKEKYGLTITDRASVYHPDALKALSEQAAIMKQAKAAGGRMSQEQLNKYEALTAKRRELNASHKGDGGLLAQGRVRSHVPIDLDEGGAKVKVQRAVMHQAALALDHLASIGVPVKELLSKHDIKYDAGSPKGNKTRGHATVGEFAMHGALCLSSKHAESRESGINSRAAAGMAPWSRSSAPGQTLEQATQTTFIHELAHAIGLKKDVDGTTSPARLQTLVRDLIKSGDIKHSDPNHDMRGNQEILSIGIAKDYVRKNISEYAVSNWLETDAELCATVLSPGYKRGTLHPKLEAHVDQLFMRRTT